MKESPPPDPERRVLLFPATRRDGEAICSLLEREAIECVVCMNAARVVTELAVGAGALVLTDVALVDAGASSIIRALAGQSPWSDLPVVLLSKAGVASLELDQTVEHLTNVTVLDRPTSSRTLLSAIRTSLRSRARQYETRDQLSALRDAENALRTSDRRKDEFLAMLAHELRNPLAPIRTASYLLPQIVPAGDARVDSTLNVIKRQVTQMTRLVDDLLDVSRITQGRIEIHRAVLELSSIVAHALESVEPLMEEKRHAVRAANIPILYVEGDGVRLVQSISNILANAAKYTDAAGEICVDVRSGRNVAVVSVRDNGIGITPELLPKVFDLFVQSERSLDRSEGGLGIGLSVVKRLIEMHGGEVAAFSNGPGLGSTFEIRLPLVSAPISSPESASEVGFEHRRVLVVDDNRDAADSLTLLLRISGHEVRTAYGPQEALHEAAVFEADVVLLDIGLPSMDGYEVARRLRAGRSTARIIALTGYGQAEDIERARAAGFDAHLVKPVELERLVEMLGTSRPFDHAQA